jgi:hypothetical protein
MIKRGDKVGDNIGFWSLLRTAKIKNITWKYPVFYIAAITAYLSYVFLEKMDNGSYEEVIPYVSSVIAPISATLMGIIIAGLAVIVALSMGEILNLLLKNKTLQKLLFPFWYCALMWSISTFLAVFLKFVPLFVSKKIEIYMISLEFFVFTYALFATVGLIGSAIKIMIIIAQLLPKK